MPHPPCIKGTLKIKNYKKVYRNSSMKSNKYNMVGKTYQNHNSMNGV